MPSSNHPVVGLSTSQASFQAGSGQFDWVRLDWLVKGLDLALCVYCKYIPDTQPKNIFIPNKNFFFCRTLHIIVNLH